MVRPESLLREDRGWQVSEERNDESRPFTRACNRAAACTEKAGAHRTALVCLHTVSQTCIPLGRNKTARQAHSRRSWGCLRIDPYGYRNSSRYNHTGRRLALRTTSPFPCSGRCECSPAHPRNSHPRCRRQRNPPGCQRNARPPLREPRHGRNSHLRCIQFERGNPRRCDT